MPVVAAVVVVAALLSLLILRSCGSDRDGEPEADGTGAPGGGPITLSEPLLVLPVLAAGPGTCANPDPPRIMGDAEQTQCLTLDTEGGMTVTRLADSSMDLVNGEWVVMLSFLAEDAARFGDLTGQAATHEPPRNQIALVLGEDRLLSAPAVAERLDDGEVQISGGFTRAQAEELAEALGVTI